MKVKCTSKWTDQDGAQHVRLFFGIADGVLLGEAEIHYRAGEACPFIAGTVYDASFVPAPSGALLTIANAKQELEDQVSVAVGSSATRQVGMDIRDATGVRHATGTMSAVRNEKGGIDYSVEVDPLELSANPSGV